ncbi:ABC transporter ATP-binding protein [Pseudooceanicola sp. CBS1P-1]|uniref:ABC transporter ATP-binding protein n=1 Tax=Pseudooceanicola albus TaxID=2692189 RepID=A0A6L7GBD1_9RHOB|nr:MULTISPECIES: ABC transporter ATP-binding protein [Pseudooceanicola]MBT9385872.1 ABC transporter ATP-binding protein [Pseudooceanicola endophyticus]MXN20103.1 ABC transporter ATP-binding protein [Pseudooceanicola albus]
MRTMAQLLEDFSVAPRGDHAPGLSEEELETLRLEAFEKGYKAGWDDAARATREEQAHIGAEFARNLQDLAFTYTEAHSNVLNAVRPMLAEVIDKVVPLIAHETLGLRIRELLDHMLVDRASQKVELVAASQNVPLLEGLMAQDFGFPLELVADDTLSDGQVFLRFAEEETEIDLDSVTEGIRGAVSGFFTEQERRYQHG